MRTRLERAAEILTEFGSLHAALLLTGRTDGWKGKRRMARAARRALDLLTEIGFPEGLTPERKRKR